MTIFSRSSKGQSGQSKIRPVVGVNAASCRARHWLPWLFMLLCGVAMPSLTAATATWTGLGANDLWSTSANWQGGVVPVAGDDLVFAGATRLTPSNDLAANTSFNSVSFASGASAFTVTGAGITLAGNITNSSANTQTITAPMTVNVATATMTGSSNIILSGVISDIGGARAIAKTGTGTLTLSGANTYSGATTISAGTLVLQGTYATPSYSIAAGAVLELYVSSGSTNYATTTFTGAGTLRKTGAGTAVWPATTATFALSTGSLIDVVAGTFVGGSYGNEVWTSNVSDLTVASGATFNGVEANVRVNQLNGAGTIQTGYPGAGYVKMTIGADNGTGGNFSGAIIDSQSSGSIEKIGTGTQILSGASTYTGITTINAGTLKLGSGGALGNTAIAVANAAIFASNPVNNTVSAGASVAGTAGATLTLASGSLLDMTNAATGTFSLQQNASFAATAMTISDATLNLDLSSAGVDAVTLAKAATCSGVNSISITTLGSSLTMGAYSIITASSGLNAGTWQFVGGGTTKSVTVGSTNYGCNYSGHSSFHALTKRFLL